MGLHPDKAVVDRVSFPPGEEIEPEALYRLFIEYLCKRDEYNAANTIYVSGAISTSVLNHTSWLNAKERIDINREFAQMLIKHIPDALPNELTRDGGLLNLAAAHDIGLRYHAPKNGEKPKMWGDGDFFPFWAALFAGMSPELAATFIEYCKQEHEGYNPKRFNLYDTPLSEKLQDYQGFIEMMMRFVTENQQIIAELQLVRAVIALPGAQFSLGSCTELQLVERLSELMNLEQRLYGMVINPELMEELEPALKNNLVWRAHREYGTIEFDSTQDKAIVLKPITALTAQLKLPPAA